MQLQQFTSHCADLYNTGNTGSCIVQQSSGKEEKTSTACTFCARWRRAEGDSSLAEGEQATELMFVCLDRLAPALQINKRGFGVFSVKQQQRNQ